MARPLSTRLLAALLLVVFTTSWTVSVVQASLADCLAPEMVWNCAQVLNQTTLPACKGEQTFQADTCCLGCRLLRAGSGSSADGNGGSKCIDSRTLPACDLATAASISDLVDASGCFLCNPKQARVNPKKLLPSEKCDLLAVRPCQDGLKPALSADGCPTCRPAPRRRQLLTTKNAGSSAGGGVGGGGGGGSAPPALPSGGPAGGFDFGGVTNGGGQAGFNFPAGQKPAGGQGGFNMPDFSGGGFNMPDFNGGGFNFPVAPDGQLPDFNGGDANNGGWGGWGGGGGAGGWGGGDAEDDTVPNGGFPFPPNGGGGAGFPRPGGQNGGGNGFPNLPIDAGGAGGNGNGFPNFPNNGGAGGNGNGFPNFPNNGGAGGNGNGFPNFPNNGGADALDGLDDWMQDGADAATRFLQTKLSQQATGGANNGCPMREVRKCVQSATVQPCADGVRPTLEDDCCPSCVPKFVPRIFNFTCSLAQLATCRQTVATLPDCAAGTAPLFDKGTCCIDCKPSRPSPVGARGGRCSPAEVKDCLLKVKACDDNTTAVAADAMCCKSCKRFEWKCSPAEVATCLQTAPECADGERPTHVDGACCPTCRPRAPRCVPTCSAERLCMHADGYANATCAPRRVLKLELGVDAALNQRLYWFRGVDLKQYLLEVFERFCEEPANIQKCNAVRAQLQGLNVSNAASVSADVFRLILHIPDPQPAATQPQAPATLTKKRPRLNAADSTVQPSDVLQAALSSQLAVAGDSSTFSAKPFDGPIYSPPATPSSSSSSFPSISVAIGAAALALIVVIGISYKVVQYRRAQHNRSVKGATQRTPTTVAMTCGSSRASSHTPTGPVSPGARSTPRSTNQTCGAGRASAPDAFHAQL